MIAAVVGRQAVADKPAGVDKQAADNHHHLMAGRI
jgi:hypothetical protein